MDLETKTIIEAYTILARALKSNGETMKKKFVHESGFEAVQGKYSHAYDTRGLLIASEDYCEMKAHKPPTDSSDLRLRVNEYGEIVHPPVAPEKPKTENWKRMTPKRQDILAQYRKDLADYEVAKAKWLELPFLNDGKTVEEHRAEFLRNRPTKHGVNHRAYYDYIQGVFEYEVPVLSYYVKGYGEVRVTAFPVTKTEIEFTECDPTNNYWTQLGFKGNASRERRNYKRNRDLDMDTEYDTDIETGEKRQLTLFNCNTSDARKLPDLNVLESFEAKPNKYLAEAYLEYILNGTELTDWQRFQLMKRNSKRTWSIH